MKVFIGADHKGFALKSKLTEYLKRAGYEVEDEGDQKFDPEDDFPEFAGRVVTAMKASNEKDPRGILICGSGQGMCIAANRFNGIFAALCWDAHSARDSRTEDNSNVLCLPSRVFEDNPEEAQLIAETWLNTLFAGATRYQRRLKRIDELNP